MPRHVSRPRATDDPGCRAWGHVLTAESQSAFLWRIHNGGMAWWKRSSQKQRAGGAAKGKSGKVDDAVVTHLASFVQTRRGVEAFIEPRTAVTQTTLLLVAWDGEWTRRVVPSPQWGHKFAESMKIPGYDAAVVGYPQRMRDYNTRNKKHPDLR